MLGNSQSYRAHRHLGVRTPHHEASHPAGDPDRIAGRRDRARASTHAHVNLPVPPVADLIISRLAGPGVEVETLGDDGTGPLDGLIVRARPARATRARRSRRDRSGPPPCSCR